MHVSLINTICINKKNLEQQNKYKKCSLQHEHDYRQKYKQFKLWVIQQAGGMMPKTTWSFSALGPWYWKTGRQGSSIHYLMSAWQMTKTVRPGCTAEVRYPNYYLKNHCNSVCGYNQNAELSVPQFHHWKFRNTLSAHTLSLEQYCLLVKKEVSKANWSNFGFATYQHQQVTLTLLCLSFFNCKMELVSLSQGGED